MIQFVAFGHNVVRKLNYLNEVACQAERGQRIKHVSVEACFGIALERDGRNEMTSWAKEDDYRRRGHYIISLMQLHCKRQVGGWLCASLVSAVLPINGLYAKGLSRMPPATNVSFLLNQMRGRMSAQRIQAVDVGNYIFSSCQ